MNECEPNNYLGGRPIVGVILVGLALIPLAVFLGGRAA